MNSRGFTLAELLIALWGSLLLAAAAHSVLRTVGGEARAATSFAHITRQQLTAWALIRHDLAQPWTADVAVPTTNSLDFHRPIGEGPVCASSGPTLLVRRSQWRGTRLPDPARDLALVLSTDSGTGWQSRGIVSVAVANCPDLGAALALTLSAPVPSPALARVAEPVRIRSYPSSGSHWLGLEPRLGPGTIQPFVGPLTTTGFKAALSGGLLELHLELDPQGGLSELLPLGGAP